ncbi:MAG: potassium transporter, partial [Zetaproteobacteria bacterium]
QEWLGGMGVVILAVAIMPMLGVGGMQLFRAEAPGPVKDKLAARVTETARVLWELYLGLTVACALLYGWFGMDGFDAINHAMTTVAIGGFSTHDASFAYFHSAALEIVAIVFMFVAGINFTLHFAALRMRTLRVYWQDDEFRAYVFWLVFAIAQLAVVVYILGDGDDPIALVFNAVSIATTTGFATSDYELWPQAAVVVMMASMYVGACAGSTGGGMKVARFLLLLRQGVREIKRLIHPHGVVSVKIGGRPVDYEVRSAVWGFFSLYVASAIAITAILAATGLDLVTAASAASACLTNTGPGFGLVGPTDNYAALPDLAKGVLIFAMILGRLELYTFFVLISPAFWRE